MPRRIPTVILSENLDDAMGKQYIEKLGFIRLPEEETIENAKADEKETTEIGSQG